MTAMTIPYAPIPHFPVPDGRRPRGKPHRRRASEVPAWPRLQGRFHYYEGHDLEAVTFPVRVLQASRRPDADPDRRHGRDPRRPEARRPRWPSPTI